MKRRPLQGRTALLLRPRGQSAELARLLRARGARVIEAPAIRIAPPASWAPLDAALRRLRVYDAVVFTSANGVERFFRRARALGLRRLPRPARLFAIGPATARALRAAGWRGARVPERFEGEALARRLGPVRGLRVLIPRAAAAREALPRILRRKGARVEVVPAYRALPDAAGLRRLRRAALKGEAQLVAFTSPSTARRFFEALGAARARDFLRAARPVSIGPVTSAALRGLGARRVLEAARYTAAGVAQAALRAARRGRP